MNPRFIFSQLGAPVQRALVKAFGQQPAIRRGLQSAVGRAPVSDIIQPAVTRAAAAPSVVRQTLQQPLEGRQLDMFKGFNRLTYPAGTKTAEGIKVGGRTYNPADVMPEGAYTQRIRELARSKGVPEELFIEQMRRPGPSLADEIDFASIPSQTGLFSGPAEFGAYQARNLLRQTGVNLADLIKANPRLSAAIAGGAGLGLAGYGVSQMVPGAPQAPVLPGPTTGGIEMGLGPNADPTSRTLAQLIAENMAMGPGTVSELGTPQYTGAERTPIITRGDADEALNAAKSQYIKPTSALDKYYRQRDVYANYPAHKSMIIGELQKQGVLDTPELVTWAGANPSLAYELYRKLPSQQSIQPKEVVTTTPIGTDLEKAAIGNSVNEALSAVNGQVGASDLSNVTTANTNLKISPMPTDIVGFIQRALLLR